MLSTQIPIQLQRVLFFDLEISGHHVEYLYHLIKYRVEHPECPEFLLVVHPDFIHHLNGLELPQDWHSKGVVIIHPSQNEMRKLSNISSLFKIADFEIQVLNRIVHEHQIEICYLMTLNKFQFAVGRQVARNLPCRIRGILFNPFGTTGNRKYDFLAKLRKHLQLKWMMRNNKLEHIYILNNIDQVNALNKEYRRRDFFLYLPDPILMQHRDPQSIVDHVPSRTHKYRFLLFGSLSKTKGIFLVLEALKQIPDEITCHIEIFFAGCVVNNNREAFLNTLTDLRHSLPAINIQYLDQFIPYVSLAALFSNSDCVLVPYIGNQSSSGVIGHAALYGKPVISPDCGLIGELVRRYQLGYLMKAMDATSLALAMTSMYRGGKLFSDTPGMRRFVVEHDPRMFVEALISY